MSYYHMMSRNVRAREWDEISGGHFLQDITVYDVFPVSNQGQRVATAGTEHVAAAIVRVFNTIEEDLPGMAELMIKAIGVVAVSQNEHSVRSREEPRPYNPNERHSLAT